MFFQYGEKEIAYLMKKDKKLKAAIETIGPIKRPVIPDLFSAVIHSIIGQQISTAANETIWRRMNEILGEITPERVSAASAEELQSAGITFRKADYIKSFGEKVLTGEFDINSLRHLPDEAVIASLSSLKGIGVWTAEMIMTFSMERPDIISFGDLAILRGLRMLYGHKKIDRRLFEKYKKRYSPYASVASLYLWAIAAGAVPGLKDPAADSRKK